MGSIDVLRQAGWRELDSKEESTAFSDFSKKCSFSLQKARRISPKGKMITVDFTDASRGAETSLRRLVIGLFQSAFSDSMCIAMDINHGMWSFEPRLLKLTDRFEPMPIGILPWAEYVVLADRDFENGIFCDPNELHIVAFGQVFTDAFRLEFANKIVIR
jgi:hypothetical protein